MSSANIVILMGNVGKDAEIRSTAGGKTVASFSFATTEVFKKDGQRTEKTQWHNVVAFGRTAEVIRDYVKKGDKLHLQGAIEYQSWDDKATSEKKYKTVIVVRTLQLLGNGQKSGTGSAASPDAEAAAAEAASLDYGQGSDDFTF